MTRRLAHHPAATFASGGRRRSQHGIVFVELAFVGMFLTIFVAGVFDFGFAWRSGLAMTEATRAAARVGSSQGDSPGADYFAMTSMQASLVAASKMDDVQQVVIFPASTADGKVPTTCTTTSPTGVCNVLNGAQLKALNANSFVTGTTDDPATGTGCLRGGSYSMRAQWCPTSRSNVQASADYMGVWIKYRHRYLFPVMGSYKDITRTTVMRLEPEQN